MNGEQRIDLANSSMAVPSSASMEKRSHRVPDGPAPDGGWSVGSVMGRAPRSSSRQNWYDGWALASLDSSSWRATYSRYGVGSGTSDAWSFRRAAYRSTVSRITKLSDHTS